MQLMHVHLNVIFFYEYKVPNQNMIEHSIEKRTTRQNFTSKQ